VTRHPGQTHEKLTLVSTLAAIPGDDEPAVLLYYCYRDLGLDGRAVLHAFFQDCCAGLRGRVRLALDGVNATLGGRAGALRAHAAAVQAHPLLAGSRIDFKLESSCEGAESSELAREARFSDLSLRLCEEVVTFGRPSEAPLSLVAPTLSPAAFHRELQTGEALLVDVRNLYETRVGRFQGALLPETRAFADFPAWAEAQAERLRGRRVLLCCTGGVRCERAGAFLRAHLGLQNVASLAGGIVRYLQVFPDGGLFRGSNFVFDERGTSAPAGGGGEPLGRCRRCAAPAGDYAPRARCPACRLLLLLCAGCAARQPRPLCELCAPPPPPPALAPPPALRILCLHGFRQTPEALRGRLRSLQRRLRSAELLFARAPHAAGGARRAWLCPGAEGQAAEAQRGGAEESLAALCDALREHAPVHGLLGFSQGAAFAFAALRALQRRPELLQGAPAPRFLWAACGFPPPPGLLGDGAEGFALPSLHVWGSADEVVPPASSAALAEACGGAQRVVHSAGHVLPAGRREVGIYASFLRRVADAADAEGGGGRETAEC